MADIIMPAFLDYQKEAAIIGRLLAGYGELEYDLSICLGATLEKAETAVRTLFRVRGEKQRIDTADALMRDVYISNELGNEYCEAIGNMHWCRTCRNQYAHCHWLGQENGLYFTNLETSAKKHGPIILNLLNVDVPLLEEQEAYFKYTQRLLTYLYHEHEKKAGKFSNHPFPAPKKQPRPRLYNPQETHPPPQTKQDNGTPHQEPPMGE